MDPGTSTWQPHWPERIRERLASLGFGSVTAYLDGFPGESMVQLAHRLGSDVAPKQLTDLHLRERIAARQVRAGAKEHLVRCIVRHHSNGWGSGQHFDHVKSSAQWKTDLKRVCGDHLQSRLDEVWRALLEVPPPADWTPRTGADPVIGRVFDEAWPEP